ncbi:MAG: OmcA/MtrC family decaheme c-type cytochrome, partial [Acidobacteriota bacterium]|nr:OmcA/MtrC family decaheme c-type cytochrome [Acidobacteriota bacterium]
MRRIPLKIMGGAIATAFVALMLIGCRGAAGQNGANGTNGTNGNDGSNGQNGTGPVINAAVLTNDEWAAMTFKGSVVSVTSGAAPVVTFKVTDSHDVPVAGLGWTSKASTAAYAGYVNMAFSVAKLVPGTNGSPSRWVSYIVTGNPTASAPTVWVPGRPTTDNIGTLVDNKNGTYQYTFRRDITQTKAQLDAYTYTGDNVKADLDDVTYQPSLTHRLSVFVGGNARGTSTNTPDGANSGVPAVPVKNPANFFYDFIPATGAPATSANEQREITSVDKCFTCHAKFEFHGAGRQDTRYCVMCHTDQRKYGRPEATTTSTGFSGSTYKIAGKSVGDLPAFIHRIHMGEELQKTGYNFANVLFNEVTFPQDHRNCVKCHTASTATPQGDNWFNKPSRYACGACHDKADWATGTGHGVANEGGPQLSDQNCVNCHDAAAIKTYHIPMVGPDTAGYVPGSHTNGATVAAYPNSLPTGANVIAWDLSSVTLNATANPVFKFRIIKNGTPVVFDPATKPELMAGYVGGPSVYLAFGLPQDGILTPADWNATVSGNMRNIWNGTAT